LPEQAEEKTDPGTHPDPDRVVRAGEQRGADTDSDSDCAPENEVAPPWAVAVNHMATLVDAS
jgi:hypothetical protein